MSFSRRGDDVAVVPNGPGAAAIVSAAVGCFVLAVVTIVADKTPGIKEALTFYRPTGALSGVSTVAIVVWIATWGVLSWRWKRKSVGMGRVGMVALVLLVLSILLTFPPIADLF